jgi:hypothetical protein
MPSGIIMQSSSVGATKEAIEKVLVEHGHEPEKPEVVEPVAPKEEDFKTAEEFEAAQEEFEATQEAEAEKENETAEDKKERERLEALPKKSRKQRAIEKATKDLKDENRKLADRLAALEAGKGVEKKEAPVAVVPKAPVRADFKTDEEFADAQFEYRYTLRRGKEQQESAQQRIDTQLKANFQNYQSQVAAFKEEHDDWDDVVSGSKIPIHDSVYLAVQELANGAQVTYYLGQHPDYANRVAEMSPLSAVIEIGRLADRLKPAKARELNQAGGADKPKPKLAPKKIPDPVRPLSSSASSSSLTSREAAKNHDFKAFKAAQRAGA